jgi:uncharacterized protein
LATELQLPTKGVLAAIELLDSGNTLPFIARYRKEATGGIDEIALRKIEDGLAHARELASRKTTVLSTIEQQGQLTAELRQRIMACNDKAILEDLYAPFKPRRRTRATAARERGLEPLAKMMMAQLPLQESREQLLRKFINPEQDVPDAAAAIAGACDIIAEEWANHPDNRGWMAQEVRRGRIATTVKRGQNDPNSKFAAYFDRRERADRIPSHRLLAMLRGEAEGVLKIGFEIERPLAIQSLKSRVLRNPSFEFAAELRATVEDCVDRLLQPAAESAVLEQLKEKAEEEAIEVFAMNLRELLLAPPAGAKVTLGIDPGFRTGCKLAVVDETGKFVTHATIYPTPPREDLEHARQVVLGLIKKYGIELIAIGNGTASRETDSFITALIRDEKLALTKVVVSESGASIYSASELAAHEYPDLDVTVRGAISIAHRLQDPLAELVKLDPKSIGVGQYQHDVNQTRLRTCLDREVESCVNAVGVDVNMASAPLLARVAGIGPKLAEKIVEYRNASGQFRNRQQILKVPKFGPKAFEQAAGFLRVRDGDQPLDNSAVHPESYGIVKRMSDALQVPVQQMIGNVALANRLKPEDFVDQRAGLPTIQDIIAELGKPGRDPRSEFKVAKFAADVNEMSDLKPGMILEGVITNVTKFGAFTDIGVHQDGLIHISELANTFVKDPSEVVAVGDVVRVKVLEVDVDRKRISLSRKQV